jgi:hypothetical protein
MSSPASANGMTTFTMGSTLLGPFERDANRTSFQFRQPLAEP